MNSSRIDLIVIGGGISGLSLAHYASKAGLKTLVLEKANATGGCLRTQRLNSFWLELGAHTCYNSYGNLIGILEDCGLNSMLQERRNVPFRMLVDGKVRSIPSLLDLLEVLCSAPRALTLRKAGLSVESYYSAIAGKKNFERVVGPALSAVVSQRANDFPAEMLFKRRPRRKDIMKKFTLKRGLQTIAETIPAGKGIEVVLGADVKNVKREGSLFKVEVQGGGEFVSERIGIAAPPPSASALLKEAFPALSEKISSIKVARVESVAAVVRKEAVALPLFSGLIPAKDMFYSIVSRDAVGVSRDAVGDDAYRGFSFHFRPGQGRERKLKRIAEVLGTDKFQDISENAAVLPSPVLGHERLISDIDRLVEGERVFLTGNYFTGLAIEDCVTRSLNEFKRLMWGATPNK